MFKQSEYCHVCNGEMKLKKNESMPALCPVCKTDLANPSSETVLAYCECDHRRSSVNLDSGELTVTNKRIFFIKGAVTAKSLGGGITKETVEKRGLLRRDVVLETTNDLSKIAVAGIAAKVKSKGAGVISVEIPHGDISSMEDIKRGTRKGVKISTRSGNEYDFYSSDVEQLKSLLSAYVS